MGAKAALEPLTLPQQGLSLLGSLLEPSAGVSNFLSANAETVGHASAVRGGAPSMPAPAAGYPTVQRAVRKKACSWLLEQLPACGSYLALGSFCRRTRRTAWMHHVAPSYTSADPSAEQRLRPSQGRAWRCQARATRLSLTAQRRVSQSRSYRRWPAAKACQSRAACSSSPRIARTATVFLAALRAKRGSCLVLPGTMSSSQQGCTIVRALRSPLSMGLSSSSSSSRALALPGQTSP